MEISFVKRRGKYDLVHIRHADRSESIDCPKQGIIPHDMVHYAVEHTLQLRGFLGRVRNGEAADLSMRAEPESDAVERLVEIFQGDAWSGSATATDDMLALYQVACAARKCPPLQVTPADILAVRQAIATLTAQWQALPVGQALHLDL